MLNIVQKEGATILTLIPSTKEETKLLEQALAIRDGSPKVKSEYNYWTFGNPEKKKKQDNEQMELNLNEGWEYFKGSEDDLPFTV